MPGHLRCDSTHGAHTARDVQLSLLASPHGSEGIADEGCDWCGEIGAFRVAAGHAAWRRLSAHTARDVQLSLLASPHGSEGIADEGCDWCGEIGAFRVAAGHAAWRRLFA